MPLMALPFLCACGSSQLPSPTARQPAQREAVERSCPGGSFTNFHRMALSFTQGYPEKIGIKINGEKEFRYSDCNSLPSGGVIVTISRELNRTLVVKVDHNNAFTKNGVATLPKTQELEIFDLKNCVAEPVSFWKKSRPTLSIKRNGKQHKSSVTII